VDPVVRFALPEKTKMSPGIHGIRFVRYDSTAVVIPEPNRRLKLNRKKKQKKNQPRKNQTKENPPVGGFFVNQ
jgi:hypothetical protein